MTDRTLTPPQADEVIRLRALLESEGKTVCIHWNDCGCCVSVHDDVEHPTGGYIVGADGGWDWYEL